MTKHVGIDLGGTTIQITVLEDGQVVSQDQNDTPGSPAEIVESIADTISAQPLDRGSRAGVTIPGPVPGPGEELYVPNLPGRWDGIDLVGEIEDRCGKPVRLLNDAHAYARGEAVVVAANGYEDVVVLTLGTGVGGGIVTGGRLYLGALGRAGEMGHIVVDPPGEPCVCQNRGCLETVASASAMARNGGGESASDLPEVARKAREGDPAALEGFRIAAAGLGHVLVAAAGTVAPQAAVIGGGAGTAVFDLLRDGIMDVLERRSALLKPMAVLKAELGSYAGSIGAALFAASQTGVPV